MDFFMEKLLAYINKLNPLERSKFEKACGTKINYLRKAISIEQRISEGLCINIERETSGVIRCEDIRPDVDWWVVRESNKQKNNQAG